MVKTRLSVEQEKGGERGLFRRRRRDLGGEEWRRDVIPQPTIGMGSIVSSPSGVWIGASGENNFRVFSVTERLSQHVSYFSLAFFYHMSFDGKPLRYHSTKFGDIVFILLLNSFVKFHAKICIYC